jgi:RND family efflux transporter MFP subunit
MKKLGFAALALVLLGGGFLVGAWWTHRPPAAPSQAQRVLYYACPMHPQYRSDHAGDCPSCGMRLEPVYADGAASPGREAAKPGTAGLIQVMPERQQAIGVQLGRVERKPIAATIRTVGRIAADETRIYRLTAATNGWIEKAMPNSVGSLVRKDEILATFYAREFLGAQQAYFYALDARDRFIAQKAADAQMASTNVQIQQSVDSLRSLGMTASQIEELGRTRERTYTIQLRAPASGFILAREISPGQRFEPGDQLYVIGDLSRIWILADVYEREARWLRPGNTVRALYQGETFPATVSNVLPSFDSETRTMKVRLELPNADYRLRPGMFVDVEFSATLPSALAVPTDAVIDSGRHKTVFVERGDGYFEPRQVETGWRIGGQVEVTKGLMEGDRIVIAGTFLIDSESRMRTAASANGPEPGPAATSRAAAAQHATHAGAQEATDPVCGMKVDVKDATDAGLKADYKGVTYYFCSAICKERFAKAPEKYLRHLPRP